MNTQQQDQHWNAGATEDQQLNPETNHPAPHVTEGFLGQSKSEARPDGMQLKSTETLLTWLSKPPSMQSVPYHSKHSVL